MDSKGNPNSSEKADSMLAVIMDRLKPILLKRWKLSSRHARRAAKEAGVQDIKAFMAGFQQGYWKGAVDVSQERLSPSDLPQEDPILTMTKTKLH
jgi:hypothetical protein